MSTAHSMTATLPEWVLSRLRCPSCRASGLEQVDATLNCIGCKATFPTHETIPDLVTPFTLPELKMYHDPHYLKWRDMLADSQDYFYQNPIVSWVQNAGHRQIRRHIEKYASENILDLGCGDGAHIPFVKDKRHYIGLDIDQKSLVKLKSRYNDALVLRGDGFNLPFNDASFSCIVNVYNLEHMIFLDLALEEMVRVLSPEGLAFVSVPSVATAFANIARRVSSAKHFNSSDFNYDRASELEHVNCIWQLERAFERHFKIVERTLFPFNIPILSTSLISTYILKAR